MLDAIKQSFSTMWWSQYNAPINVKPQGGGGRPGIGGGFDVIGLPVVGTFDHSLSPGGLYIPILFLV